MRKLAVSLLLVGACSGATPPAASSGGSGATTVGTTSGSTGSMGSTGSGGSTGGSTSSGTSGSSGCGGCASGETCGTANGHPVCRTASGIPRFSHVFVIPMENTSWSTLDQSTNTPFLHGLKDSAAYSTAYHGVAHPSLPNYLALISGSDQGVGCDCHPTGGSCNAFTCNRLVGSCGCGQSGPSLADQFAAAGTSWRTYAEDLPWPCPQADGSGFAVRHVPFLYFSGVTGDASACADHVVDFSQFGPDLTAGPRIFNFIVPNLTDDMHDPSFPNSGPQNLANGDTWLSQVVPTITASPAFQDNGILVIVWDEDDDSGGVTGTDDPVPMFVLSPLAKAHYPSAVRADHYDLLATLEEGLGLPRLGNAQQATPLADFFPDR